VLGRVDELLEVWGKTISGWGEVGITGEKRRGGKRLKNTAE